MNQHQPLINAAKKMIDNAELLLGNEETPFEAMYRQFKNLQSLWLRMVETASDTGSRKLEDICIDLELTMAKCEQFLKDHPKPIENTNNDEIEKSE